MEQTTTPRRTTPITTRRRRLGGGSSGLPLADGNKSTQLRPRRNDDNVGLSSRRQWLFGLTTRTAGAAATILCAPPAGLAKEEEDSAPYLPPGPEERSGLVVLRVAEVAAFQEKLLRGVVNGEVADFTVTPQQIAFGTQILLRNSNLAGNLRLMIDAEIPRGQRRKAAARAAATMNTLQAISTTAGRVDGRPFTQMELLEIADLYRDVRLQLNALYEYLPDEGKDKYYGYFMAVTEYEKKQAEGTYNPELDGVLRFEY